MEIFHLNDNRSEQSAPLLSYQGDDLKGVKRKLKRESYKRVNKYKVIKGCTGILLIIIGVLLFMRLMSNPSEDKTIYLVTDYLKFRYFYIVDNDIKNFKKTLDDNSTLSVIGYSSVDDYYIYTSIESDGPLQLSIAIYNDNKGGIIMNPNIYNIEKFPLATLEFKTSFRTSPTFKTHNAFVIIKNLNEQNLEKMIDAYDEKKQKLHLTGNIKIKRLGIFTRKYKVNSYIDHSLLIDYKLQARNRSSLMSSELDIVSQSTKLVNFVKPFTRSTTNENPTLSNVTYIPGMYISVKKTNFDYPKLWDPFNYFLYFENFFKFGIIKNHGVYLYMDIYTLSDNPKKLGTLIMDAHKIPYTTYVGRDVCIASPSCHNCSSLFIPTNNVSKIINSSQNLVDIMIKNMEFRPSYYISTSLYEHPFEFEFRSPLLIALNALLKKKTFAAKLETPSLNSPLFDPIKLKHNINSTNSYFKFLYSMNTQT